MFTHRQNEGFKLGRHSKPFDINLHQLATLFCYRLLLDLQQLSSCLYFFAKRYKATAITQFSPVDGELQTKIKENTATAVQYKQIQTTAFKYQKSNQRRHFRLGFVFTSISLAHCVCICIEYSVGSRRTNTYSTGGAHIQLYAYM